MSPATPTPHTRVLITAGEDSAEARERRRGERMTRYLAAAAARREAGPPPPPISPRQAALLAPLVAAWADSLHPAR